MFPSVPFSKISHRLLLSIPLLRVLMWSLANAFLQSRAPPLQNLVYLRVAIAWQLCPHQDKYLYFFSVTLCWHCGSYLVQKCCTLCPEQVASGKGCDAKWQIYLQVFKEEILSVFFTVLQPALEWLEISWFTFSYSWRENSTRRMHL